MTVITLWKQGKSKKEIAELVGKDRKTVRKIIKEYAKTGSNHPKPISRINKFDTYKDQIISYLEQARIKCS